MDVSKLSPEVLSAVRQNLGCDDEDDESHDSEIMAMGKLDIFERFLSWNGIIGFGADIWAAVESIKEASEPTSPGS